MKRLLLLFSIPILALMLLSQHALPQSAPQTPPVTTTQPVVPSDAAPAVDVLEPTATEALSIKYVTSEFDQAWKDLRAIQAQVIKDHPGYHLADNGRIEKNPPTPVKPAEKQPQPTKK